MDKDILQLLDGLVPRGGKAPVCLHVTLEEYLARVANLYLKISGVDHRREAWTVLSKEHLDRFEKSAAKLFNRDLDSKFDTRGYALSDRRLANEFEMLMYSINSALEMLTRVVASFLNGATDTKRHSKMADLLAEHPQLDAIRQAVEDNSRQWIGEMKERRDAATHYIGLGIRSAKGTSTKDQSGNANYEVSVSIPERASKKTNSVWNEDLPIAGGTEVMSLRLGPGVELQGLFDSSKQLILVRERTVEEVKMMDGGVYVDVLYAHFQEYLKAILGMLVNQLDENRIDPKDRIDFDQLIDSYINRLNQ